MPGRRGRPGCGHAKLKWPEGGPSVGRVLADATVDGFTQQVGVSGVTGVLLDEVGDEPPQVRAPTVGHRGVDELVEAVVGESRRQPRAGSLDGAVVEVVQLFGGVVGGRRELPVVAAVPARHVPGGPMGSPRISCVNV